MESIRVLLVDDSPDFLASAADLLSRAAGVTVEGLARSGPEGVRLTAALSPDVVLMDLSMPGMNGLAATRAIKAQAKAPAVVLVTLHDQPELRRSAAEAGADGFLCKGQFGDSAVALITAVVREGRVAVISGRQDADAGGTQGETPVAASPLPQRWKAPDIRVVILGTRLAEAERAVADLRNAGFDPAWRQAHSEGEFASTLEPAPDLVLACDTLGRFDGLQALQLLRRRDLDIPVIILSATASDDEVTEWVTAGVTDYVLTGQPGRLGQSVARALWERQLKADLRRGKILMDTERHLLAMTDAGAPLTDVLDRLARTVESQSKGMLCSILLLDADGMHLRHGAAPSLPEAYCRAIDGVTIGPRVGSCGTAAFRKSPVVVVDIATDPLWSDYRDLALHHGLRACWSTPILTSGGLVLGTFALYYDTPRLPDPFELALIDRASAMAGIAIERLRALGSLHEAQARLQLATQASNLGPWDWNLVTNKVHFSPEWKRQIGYAEGEISNQYLEWESRLHPDDRDRIMSAVRAFIADPPVGYDVEFRLRHKNGSYRWIQTRGLLTCDAAGTPVRMLGCHLDVTARKEAEVERAQQARLLQLLLDSTEEGVFGVHLTGRCTFINRAAAAMIGRDPDAVVGQPMHELIQHSHSDRSPYPPGRSRILRTVQDGEGCRVDDEVFWRSSGTSFLVGYVANPLVEDGVVQGAVVTFADITERRRLAAQSRQAQKLEALGLLTGGVAHDFNNLLTAILGYSELLLDELAAGDPHRAEVTEIRKAGESAAALTRQLLAFSRQQVLQPVVVSLNERATSVEKLLRRLVGENVAVSLMLDSDLWPILADPSQVEQVLMNLTVNARDAMPLGGTLTIETANVEIRSDTPPALVGLGPGRYAKLTVRDTGAGMSEAVKSRIFDPFFTTKGTVSGTGLGLATVFGIVAQSGGVIDVHSTEGSGTSFEAFFPATQGVPPLPPRPPADDQPHEGSERVVLVEDEAAVRKIALATLERAGYTVQAFATAEEAVALAADEHIDMLITDIVLPNLNGAQLAMMLKAGRPALTVLYTSGYTASVGLDEKGLDLREAFLEKPYTPQHLLRKIREVLDAR